MSSLINQSNLDILVTNSKCCYVNKIAHTLNLRIIGDPMWKKSWYDAWRILELIRGLENYVCDDSTCLTDEEICLAMTELSHLCNNCC